MKKHEIITLRSECPELYLRALAIEDGAQKNLISISGLGRRWAWRDMVATFDNQISMCDAFEDISMPCGCYDGNE